MTISNESFLCLSDDFPKSGHCADCGVALSGPVVGSVSDTGEYAVYVHVCPTCGRQYMRLFKSNNIL